ncbi:MAG: DMT family transporter [Gemmatimonadaceae bacterium]|nr:DMT family transporter [Gemmatimonadaceae bacterium]
MPTTPDAATPARAVPPAVLTTVALVAFAGNSLLCRLALARTPIDAASFTAIRLTAGAATLFLVLRTRRTERTPRGSWRSAMALFAYAAGFSFAYLHLTAGTGALLLFGAVQATMISVGLARGERLALPQAAGLLVACAGLVALVLPGLSAPPLGAAALMTCAGIAWGIYSLRAKDAGDATSATAGNFLRAVPMAALLLLVSGGPRTVDAAGVLYAVASGALASGLGYAIWYAALRSLRATTAATVQLSVPVIASAGGVMLLQEPVTLRLVLCGAAILGGVLVVVLSRARRQVGL